MSQDRGDSRTIGPTLPTYRLALITLSATLLLIVVGGFTRGSGSGYGCADRWPLCENGLAGGWLPRAEYHMIVEWSHRWLAVTVGLLAVATAMSAWRHHRGDRPIVVSAIGVVAVIALQAWIGRAVVRAQLDEDLVTLHLAISLTIAAFLMVVVMSVRFPRIERLPAGGWLRLVALSAGGVFTVIVLGSLVHNLYFPGWPLMGGTFIPDLGSRSAHLHFLHRLASGSYAVIAVWLWRSARLRERPGHEVSLLGVAALLYVTNIAVGAAHVFTQVNSAALVAIHLGLASTVWVLTGAVAVSAARLRSVRGSLKV